MIILCLFPDVLKITSFPPFLGPYGISGLEANTLSTTAVRLTWVRPPQYKSDYRYRIETAGCASKNTTVMNEEADISELTPGTNCTFCVSVMAVDGIEGESDCNSQYTSKTLFF